MACNSQSTDALSFPVYVQVNGTWTLNGTVSKDDIPVEEVLARAIQRNYLKVICAIGLPGNLAAILAIATARWRSTASLLLALLAASDSAALVVKLVINQLSFSLDSFSDHYCRSTRLPNVFSTYANWLLVLIAAVRLVAVVRPLASKRVLGPARVCGLCVLMALPIVGLHAPLLAGLVRLAPCECGVTVGVAFYAGRVWPWLNTLVYAPLPMAALLAINAGLSVSLRRAGRRRRHLLSGGGGGGGGGSRGRGRGRGGGEGGQGVVVSPAAREAARSEWAITAMVLAASLLFMLLVLPQCFYYLLFQYTDVYAALRLTPAANLARQVTTLMADSTHALNFYLYIVCVRRFRRQFFSCVCAAGRRGRRAFRRRLSLRSSHGGGGCCEGGGARALSSANGVRLARDRRSPSSSQHRTTTTTASVRTTSSVDQAGTGADQTANKSSGQTTASVDRAGRH